MRAAARAAQHSTSTAAAVRAIVRRMRGGKGGERERVGKAGGTGRSEATVDCACTCDALVLMHAGIVAAGKGSAGRAVTQGYSEGDAAEGERGRERERERGKEWRGGDGEIKKWPFFPSLSPFRSFLCLCDVTAQSAAFVGYRTALSTEEEAALFRG